MVLQVIPWPTSALQDSSGADSQGALHTWLIYLADDIAAASPRLWYLQQGLNHRWIQPGIQLAEVSLTWTAQRLHDEVQLVSTVSTTKDWPQSRHLRHHTPKSPQVNRSCVALIVQQALRGSIET